MLLYVQLNMINQMLILMQQILIDLLTLKEFEKVARDESGQVKPIVIVTVDGGPDENPRFPKTLVASIRKFKKYNLDALFVLTHA